MFSFVQVVTTVNKSNNLLHSLCVGIYYIQRDQMYINEDTAERMHGAGRVQETAERANVSLLIGDTRTWPCDPPTLFSSFCHFYTSFSSVLTFN